MSDLGVVLVGLAIAGGIAGVLLPVLPGALLVWAAIAVWAFAVSSTTGWAAFAVATLLIGGGQVVKYLVPGRRLRDAGVPIGIYVEERRRLTGHASAWMSTRHALRAIGLSITIELASTVLAAGVWLAAVLS